MSEIITVGLDLAKRVFQVHGADVTGQAILRKKLSRDKVLPFFRALPPCTVAMEACGGSHFWGREIARPGTWLAGMLSRKPPMLVRVALANKMARIAWALMAKEESYRTLAVAA